MNVYEEVASFYERYQGAKRIIGRSREGRNLYAFHIGSMQGPQCISQCAIHGREWITGLIALYHVRRSVVCGGVWVLPLINPDGALLSEIGLCIAPKERQKALLEINKDDNFSLWKANINAVDLNVNFDARWGMGAWNLKHPAGENYIGPAPFSEPETRALRDFTLEILPNFTVSWHTKGEEIYWEFHQPLRRRVRDKLLAQVLSQSTGYPLKSVKNSVGGYKDWCIEKLKIPAFTVEVGSDLLAHPIGRASLPALLRRTLDALADLMNASQK